MFTNGVFTNVYEWNLYKRCIRTPADQSNSSTRTALETVKEKF